MTLPEAATSIRRTSPPWTQHAVAKSPRSNFNTTGELSGPQERAMTRRESVAGLNRRSDGVQHSQSSLLPLNYANYSDTAFVSATPPMARANGTMYREQCGGVTFGLTVTQGPLYRSEEHASEL